jgi:hypothetical protein
MEINGKIIELLEVKSGESAKGPWRKQEYIIETDSQYPKKICFMAWSDKIDEFAIKEGESLIVSVDLESREYNGRWYTDVKAWKVTRAGAGAHDTPYTAPEEYKTTQSEGPDQLNNKQSESPHLLDDVIPF